MSESDPKDGAPPRTILGVAPPPPRERTIHGVAPAGRGGKLPRQQTLLGVAVDPNRAPPPDAPPPPPDHVPKPALELVLSSTSLPAGVPVGGHVGGEPAMSPPVDEPVSLAPSRDDIMSLAPAGVPRRGRVGRVVLVLLLGAAGVAGYVERRRISSLVDRYVLAPAPAPTEAASSATASASSAAAAPPSASAAGNGTDPDAGRSSIDGGAHRPRGPHLPRGRSH